MLFRFVLLFLINVLMVFWILFCFLPAIAKFCVIQISLRILVNNFNTIKKVLLKVNKRQKDVFFFFILGKNLFQKFCLSFFWAIDFSTSNAFKCLKMYLIDIMFKQHLHHVAKFVYIYFTLSYTPLTHALSKGLSGKDLYLNICRISDYE